MSNDSIRISSLNFEKFEISNLTLINLQYLHYFTLHYFIMFLILFTGIDQKRTSIVARAHVPFQALGEGHWGHRHWGAC